MTHKTPSFQLHNPEPLLIVISGPSGVGKDTVVEQMKNHGLPFHFVVTVNTRPPRADETHGVDYFFITMEEFKRMVAQDELLEYAPVYSDFKGVPKDQVRQAFASGKDVVMRLDVQGAATIRKLYPEALLIFLTTADEQELIDRLKARKTEDPEELQVRITNVQEELKSVQLFDYVVINRENELQETIEIIAAIIHAEHHRVTHRKVSL